MLLADSFPLALPDDVGSWSVAQWAGVIAMVIVSVLLFTGLIVVALTSGVEGLVLAVFALIVLWIVGQYVWTAWLAPLFGVS
jgi:hypothetical protein